MRKIKYLIVLSGLIMCINNVQGQYYSFKDLVKSADEAYNNKHYYKALNNYTQAIEQNEDAKPQVFFAAASAAQEVNALNYAKEYYQKYIDSGDTEFESVVLYQLAKLEHQIGEYDKAIINYNLYSSEYGGQDAKIDMDISQQKEAAQWALSNETEESIEYTERLSDTINTNSSENAPVLLGEDLIYASLRFPIEDDEYQRSRTKILRNGDLVDIPNITEEQLTSNSAFNSEGTKMIFTICDYVNTYSIHCKLYSADVGPNLTIRNVQPLPSHINQPNTNSTHPTIGEVNGQTFMYFSSDRAGGKGQYDIYKVLVDENNVMGAPTNVLEVNTPGNDMTPYFHNATETLYFSTDGRNGYGGYDIFKTNKEASEPVNLGKNINSSYNELYYTLAQDGIRGHFTSNRPGSSFAEDKYETCCYDIYSAKSKKCIVTLNTLTFDDTTKESLDQVMIKVISTKDNTLLYEKSLAGNENNIELPCNEDLKLIASKDGYDDYELNLTELLKGQKGDEVISKDLFLIPNVIGLELAVFEEVARAPLTGATVYLTNLATNEIQTQEMNPGHIFNFDIRPDTDYLIEINKDGFKEETIKLNSGKADVKITKEAILKYVDVVEKSIVSLENAIPVSLYFDNDRPKIGSNKNESAQTYSQIYGDYYSQKPKFRDAYLALFSGSDRVTAFQEVDYLFENLVKASFDKYDTFKKQLQIVLEAGQDVNVYLRGYTSPLAQGDYNTALGKRRVDSIRKEFDTWNNGVLVPYILSGQLKVTERSFGETTAPASVSDDPSAPSRSIYSPEASRERRVEIDEIKIQR